MRQYKAVLALLVCACGLRAQNFVNGQAARAVIGQTTFTQGNANPSQQILGGVSGLAYANGQLYVADANRVAATPQDHRVMVFNVGDIPAPHADLSQNFTPITNSCYLCGYLAVNSLGQPSYTPSGSPATFSPGRTNDPTKPQMNTPTAVATDGHILAVADTDNNRVLLWTSLPTTMDQSPNIVLGQPDFTTLQQPQPVTASALRGPQGVWIENGKLFVADTQNYRVLIWNSIPTKNNQPADLVLGQSNFVTGTQPACDPTKGTTTTAANQLCNPVSVTVSPDGNHLFVSDLGFNRVLIWNSIPTSNGQGADVVIGQPDMTSAAANNSAVCPNGAGPLGQCAASINFPRYALSDGRRLFVADGGNDRVLIFNSIPTTNGASADVVLGQPNFTTDVVSNQTTTIASTSIDNTGAVDITSTPLSLAFDGFNLYVSDAYNRRVLVFTPGDTSLPNYSAVNWASEIIRQEGIVSLAGTPVANDTATITIQNTGYSYTVKSGDTLDKVAQGLISAINTSNSGAGDPNATAIFAGTGTASVYLSSKAINLAFDAISLAASTSNNVNMTATASGSYLSAGTAATAAPGMLIEINGTNLSDVPASNPVQAPLSGTLPTTLGGAQVYMDGIPSPVLKASATQIVSQVPYNFTDRNSTSVYVRTTHANGAITVTNSTPVYIAPANPGLFNAPDTPDQPRPWPASMATHQPGNPTSVVSIDGTAKAGDTATITINGANYTYTVQANDTLNSIVTGLVNAINNAPDPNVTASAGGAFARVVLTARAAGAAGTGISIGGSVSASAQVTVTPYTTSTCCNVQPGSPISPSNPAAPGELITVKAAGLGIVTDPSGTAQNSLVTGQPYKGPVPNTATNFVSATLGTSTAQVITAGLPSGSYGMYDVQIIIPSGAATNNVTPLSIAQNAYVSNTVTIPVGPAVAVPPPTPAPASPISISIDTPSSSGAPLSLTAPIGGWAISTNGGITSIGLAVDGTSVGTAGYGGSRPDVCNAFPGAAGCPNVGWNALIDTTHLANGTHTLSVTATDATGARATAGTSFTVGNATVSSATRVFIDSPGPGNNSFQGVVSFAGWSVNDNSAITSVNASVDGVPYGAATYGGNRPDVCTVFPGRAGCPNVGWSFLLDTTKLANGTHSFAVTATAADGTVSTVGNDFTVANWTTANPTHISIDTPSAQSGAFGGVTAFGGWAINDAAPIAAVNVSIDGVLVGPASYGGSRPDVCTAFPNRAGCPNVGWNIAIDTTQLGDGTHTLQVTAIPVGGQASTVSTQFTVTNLGGSNPMNLAIDSPNPSSPVFSGPAQFGGWAITSNGSISSVQILVDGVSRGFAAYGGNRPDVCAVFPSSAGCPNVGWNVFFDTTTLTNGSHILQVRALSSTGQSASLSRAFTVSNPASAGPGHVFIDLPNSQSTPFVGLATFYGWAINDNAAIASVAITVDGVPYGTAQYGASRPDVCTAYPGRAGCPNVGWSFTLDTTQLADGNHTLGVTAMASGGTSTVASVNFTVGNWSAPNPMMVTIENPSPSSGTISGSALFSGWALQNNVPLNLVQVSIDGVPYGPASYGATRADVCTNFPSGGGCPNVGWSFLVDTTLLFNGQHTLAVTGSTYNGYSSTATTKFTVFN